MSANIVFFFWDRRGNRVYWLFVWFLAVDWPVLTKCLALTQNVDFVHVTTSKENFVYYIDGCSFFSFYVALRAEPPNDRITNGHYWQCEWFPRQIIISSAKLGFFWPSWMRCGQRNLSQFLSAFHPLLQCWGVSGFQLAQWDPTNYLTCRDCALRLVCSPHGNFCQHR